MAKTDAPTTVAVSKLKASLGSYLDRVKAGEEVAITEHGRIIARFVPARPTPAELEELIKAGILRPPKTTERLPPDFWDTRPTDPDGLVLKALLEEREEAPD